MIADTRCHSFDCNVLCFCSRHKRGGWLLLESMGMHNCTECQPIWGDQLVLIRLTFIRGMCVCIRAADQPRCSVLIRFCVLFFLVLPSLCDSLCSSFEWLREYSNFACMVRCVCLCTVAAHCPLHVSSDSDTQCRQWPCSIPIFIPFDFCGKMEHNTLLLLVLLLLEADAEPPLPLLQHVLW